MKNCVIGMLAVAATAGIASAGGPVGPGAQLLFPFDSSNPVGAGWTQSMGPNDDGSTGRIDLGFDFCFYQGSRTSVIINNNGNLSFSGPYSAYSPSGFPQGGGFDMIAPFWADVDTRNRTLSGTGTNLVWHRTFDTNADSAPDVFVVTWDDVGWYSGQNTPRNTFQVAIAANPNQWGAGLNAAFSYGDMNWTTGQASGGGPFGGSPATVGINRGDGVDYSQLGRFDHAGFDYNEISGGTSGVDFLDNRDFFFDACGGIVPAPTAGALFGLAGLAAFRRRR